MGVLPQTAQLVCTACASFGTAAAVLGPVAGATRAEQPSALPPLLPWLPLPGASPSSCLLHQQQPHVRQQQQITATHIINPSDEACA